MNYWIGLVPQYAIKGYIYKYYRKILKYLYILRSNDILINYLEMLENS